MGKITASRFSPESENTFNLPSGYLSSVSVHRLETSISNDHPTLTSGASASAESNNLGTDERRTHSGFRLVLVDIPGPLVSASFVVPTQSWGDAGEAHTLEHLVFCGSKFLAPHRGYLDLLANRSLSTGTNAYTTEDHTAYLAVTVGLDGMLNLLPVFLDHVLHPTLRDSQFSMEVHHVDGQGSHQGVVYCEMASRENTEGDLLDHAIRRHIFSNTSTYSRECGGLTPEIVKLNNEAIKRYHAAFYTLDNLTLILCGHQISPDTVFDRLLSVFNFALGEPAAIPPSLCDTKPPPSLPPFQSFTHYFPAGDSAATQGSLAYAWPGPPSEDVKTHVALDVLIRYLTETASSPLSTAFVEKETPWASTVDGDVRGWVWGAILIEFSGVPYEKKEEETNDAGTGECKSEDGVDLEMQDAEVVDGAHADDPEWEDVAQSDQEGSDESDSEGDDDDDDDSDESSDDDDSTNSSDLPDLFSGGLFHGHLRSTMESLLATHALTPSTMGPVLHRHRIKLLEALQEDPHDVLASSLVPDIVRHFSAPSSQIGDTRAEGGVPAIGTRMHVFDEIDRLEKEGTTEFWETLLQKWFLDAPCVEVMMLPSPELAERQASQKSEEQKSLIDSLGPDGLARLQKDAEVAVEENKINLPKDVVAAMPPVPDATQASRIPVSVVVKQIDGLEINEDRPFGIAQLVRTETAFASVKVVLNTAHLPDRLRPYLVLFQELLFATPLITSKTDSGTALQTGLDTTTEVVPWNEVATRSSHLLASHSAAVGLGNDIFHTSWLAEVFVLEGSCLPEELSSAASWLIRVLLCSTWTKERTLAVARNLISDCVDTERDASGMVVAVGTRVMSYKDEERERKGNGDIHRKRSRTVANLNDAAISIFAQKKFLKKIVKQIRSGDGQSILDKLEEVKRWLIAPVSTGSVDPLERTPGYIQLSFPINSKNDSPEDWLNTFLASWDAEFKMWKSIKAPSPMQKMPTKSTRSSNQRNHPPDEDSQILSPFPFPRTPFNTAIVSEKFTRSVAVPIKGVTASFLSQVVPCDLLETPFHPDHYPVVLLCELISRTEGPLYTAVRGSGHAYGASVGSFLWTGQLGVDIHDSQEPRKALLSFYNIIEQLGTEEGWRNLCSEFDIETARASVAYRIVAARSTGDGVISEAMRAALRGYGTLEAEEAFQRSLYSVTATDLHRVYGKYFRQFLDPDLRVTILTCPPSPISDSIMEQFATPPTEVEMGSSWRFLKRSEGPLTTEKGKESVGRARKKAKPSRTAGRTKSSAPDHAQKSADTYVINFKTLAINDLELELD
ncbi:hypothetical protein M427DRAFT_132722 [Gonapodya prolifera JEL478]|uniref:Peptidase M16 N-terminal domain-containing protein n=1 Tax=Gonapodya prolifera (strain JEL478) TaxID=1344416 RepID=A0A139APB3_GONPJ|nr:hypothetical protein M427DRAFT_132722 [Gonapodya prolifera JEL478]|eukprot:KXS18353.1 hypothetical protein M427DRAFT_132722 [Gonapodya prolifera JEL478]